MRDAEALWTKEDAMSQEHNGRTGSGSKYPVSQMRVKRSVSPDGRIDSLSVEITSPLEGLDPDELARRAREIVAGEAKVVEVFLGRNGTEPAPKPSTKPKDNGETPAHMLAIGGMDTEWGRRLFVTFRVNGETARVFGSPKKLAGLLAAAGTPLEEAAIGEGVDMTSRVGSSRAGPRTASTCRSRRCCRHPDQQGQTFLGASGPFSLAV